MDLTATVCATSRPELGVLIVQDESGVELLQLGVFNPDIRPGDRIRIHQNACYLRNREMGVEISTSPIVMNDGLHARVAASGSATLPKGKIPIRLEWFNYWRTLGLDVLWAVSNQPPANIDASNLWHTVVNGSVTNFVPGLRAESYEGTWETIPDFNLLQPVKIGVVTNFDLSFRSRYERVGIRFSGYLEVPRAGDYEFQTWSDDGSILYLENPHVSVSRLGQTSIPAAAHGTLLGTQFSDLDERRWTTVEGRVSFVVQIGEGLQFDLGTDRHVIKVRLADAAGLEAATLRNARIRVTGVARGVMATDNIPLLGKIFLASPKNLTFLDAAPGQGELKIPITSVAQVQGLPIERARQALPVRIRGTVTGAMKTTQEHWMSFQDDTRGIFVTWAALSNAAPAVGEIWELAGHSGAGDFAPIIVAEELTRVGEGLLPAPVTPTWAELLNGSRDVQWAELKGLVTDVQSNTISLHLPEGRLAVELEGRSDSELKPFLKDVVRIRGVLYAVWDPITHEVRVGSVMMRNSAISVDVSAPADPFDAVLRTPRELLLFDVQASAFRPVKVRGQVVYADPTQLFLESAGTGLRLLPMGEVTVRPGDLVEAVGYPDIGRAELLLRETLLKKTGTAPLAKPKKLDESDLTRPTPNSTRVRVEGKLLGWHTESGALVFELQSGTRLYLARLPTTKPNPVSLRVGSRLGLVGVYFGRGQTGQVSSADNESFALLLNSLSDITVLSQPSWWTLPRLLALMGTLSVILIVTVLWNRQLQRQVEQRTSQLQHEIRERERLERQNAIETERSRIARDLHDDLGASLTEISVLASTGQLPRTDAAAQTNLLRSIGNSARSLVSALDIIVWAVDPEDNTLQSLADYLTGYTNDFFSHTQIACRFKVPVSCPPITLDGRVRHDLLMVVKETLNNIVRHANATEVEFHLGVVAGSLEIDIADNGKGIENETPTGGHGLKNLSARLKKLEGTCAIEPRPGGGTIVKIRLPLGEAVEARPPQQDTTFD